MSVREDPWLAGVLGRPVYAVDGPVESAGQGLYYAKIPVEDVPRVHALEERGFSVVDVNMTLVRGPDADRPAAPRATVVAARSEHHDALLDVAGSCFRYSRFHLDPAIPAELADRVKREWIRSYVERKRGLELLTALDGDVPVGFLAVLERNGTRVIDLVGVAASAQGRGFGGALVAAFVERHAAAGRELVVGTQVANVPSLRLYAAHGFVPRAAAYVLHRHVERS